MSAVFALALAAAGMTAGAAGSAKAVTLSTVAFVADADTGMVEAVDVASNTLLSSTYVGSIPVAVVTSPDNTAVYAASQGNDRVSVLNPATAMVTRTIPVCPSSVPVSEAVRPDGTQLWVGCGNDTISVVDTASGLVVRTVNTSAAVAGIKFTGTGNSAFVLYQSTTSSSGIEVFNTATGLQTAAIVVPGQPSGFAVSPDGATAYVGTGVSLAVIDTAAGTVATTLAINGSSGDGVLDPAGTAFSFCAYNKLAVVDVASRSLTAEVPTTCDSGVGLAFTPDGKTLYAPYGPTVNAIDAATGKVTATITGFSGPRAIAMAQVAFRPAVYTISPAQGPEAGGTTVTISGRRLTGATAVTFGTTPAASFTVDSDTRITAVSPPHADGPVEVSVTTDNGTNLIPAENAFTYQETAPTVTGLSPNSGVSRGGNPVVITGTDLATTTSVYFGGTAASSFIVDSDTQITAVPRAQTDGTIDVTVTNSAGTSPATAADKYTFFPPIPAITSISPASGPAAGGTTVTIIGAWFTGAFRVSFGGTAAAFTVNSSTQITATAPPGTPGTVDVAVSTDVDTSQTQPADQYTYVGTTTPAEGRTKAAG